MGYFLIVITCGVLILSLVWYFTSNTTKPIPEIKEIWWVPGNEKLVDDKIRPFFVNFSQEYIQDLKYRLKHTRDLTPPLKDVAWNYGTNTDALRKVLDHWANNYNFEEREEFINQYPQFKTNIQGLDIHFLRIKPLVNEEEKRILPLLLLHGWPGSVIEFYKIIPWLTVPFPGSEHDFVFEVVAPSLPGFGFSSAATIPGLSHTQIAIILKNLMLRLGFDKFYVQGGDWGGLITADMSALFPQHVLGMHSNFALISEPWVLLKEILYSYLPACLSPCGDFQRQKTVKEEFYQFLLESGYFHIQATKPDTIGVGLNDSPAGLAAYILEKFSTGTNPSYKSRMDGGLLEKFTYDELIDNLMIYWTSNSMTTAMRIYAERFTLKRKLSTRGIPITVPSAIAQFPYEIKQHSTNILKHVFVNLIRVTKMPRGGHFAAFEEPRLFANDIWASVNEMEALRGNNKKNNSEL